MRQLAKPVELVAGSEAQRVRSADLCGIVSRVRFANPHGLQDSIGLGHPLASADC